MRITSKYKAADYGTKKLSIRRRAQRDYWVGIRLGFIIIPAIISIINAIFQNEEGTGSEMDPVGFVQNARRLFCLIQKVSK
ncbi:hypothetical protein DXF96_13785 [Heyndrickxia coagulans]|uniref:Uncharacterized protein n=1 Tax=Heyndrickxia coagulans TaxID=1398 RepID=A0AAN0WC24_HEYCO|nr:hypothetical protein SB48_HM08orf03586 [Heyndrickxia coagulans]APB36122.1 hypothetical protein BIZ35_04350 [Heyndrickxia coagulans]ATW83260.1 hypothetical protein CIW84_09855 [Heyndrickxia coagulans]AVD56081.1 hypothetical protein C3766_08015 [Heyndrickxia coagulans]AWP36976.1 hypothetical protein CYJ15_08260 [Heyndrickxia coagulans]